MVGCFMCCIVVLGMGVCGWYWFVVCLFSLVWFCDLGIGGCFVGLGFGLVTLFWLWFVWFVWLIYCDCVFCFYVLQVCCGGLGLCGLPGGFGCLVGLS